MKAVQLELDFGVTAEQSCIMCHLSSECEGCCMKCNNPNCGGQMCSQPFKESESARWNAWMHLVRTHFPHLRKFIPKKYQKRYNL